VGQRTLLLAAHGSSRPDSNNPILRLADSLRGREPLSEVQCGFLQQQPLLEDILSQLQTQELIVIPMFSGYGYITDKLIPQALGQVSSEIRVRLFDPIGVHAEIPRIMAKRASSIIKEHALEPAQVSVLIAAHGNTKNTKNSDQTIALASSVQKLMNGITTNAAFIEEAPLVSDWPQMTTAEHLIVLPYLIGGGLHAQEDIPIMLGMSAGNYDKAPVTGPLSAHGRTIWYCRALGFEEALIDIIIGLVSK
jgi:sirohydrochlorin cobaltochelatase